MLARKNGSISLKNLRSERGKRLRMYKPEIKRKRSGAPVLSRNEINSIGENLVEDFMPDAMKNPQEVDIDLFAQDYLKVEQDFQYLSHCGVYLGMTVFNDTNKVPVYDPVHDCADYISAKANTVIIDRTLLEENQEHRYRFTMGHECGHVFLHPPYFEYDPYQMNLADLLGEDCEAAMVQCRVDLKKSNNGQQKVWTDKDWMEWQANALSSAILMPRKMVMLIVEDIRKKCVEGIERCYEEADTISRVFNVSFQAATYRLSELGIMREETDMNQKKLCLVLSGMATERG